MLHIPDYFYCCRFYLFLPNDVNLPVNYVCCKKTDILPFFTGKIQQFDPTVPNFENLVLPAACSVLCVYSDRVAVHRLLCQKGALYNYAPTSNREN